MSDPIRIGLVDDHGICADAVSILLEAELDMRVVWTAGDGETAIERCREDAPDVVVMDVNLPGVNGIAATRQITAEHEHVKVLVVTGLSDPDLVARVVDAGACGLLTKQRAGDDLVRDLRAAAGGSIVVPPQQMAALIDRLRAPAAERSPETALTDREVEVLQGFADGLSTGEVAERLFISPRTVQGHVQSILGKLRVRSKLEAVLYGLRHGIVQLRPVADPPSRIGD